MKLFLNASTGWETNNSIRKQTNKNRKWERKPVHQSGHHLHCYSISNHWQRQMFYEGNKGDAFSIAFRISNTCRQKIRPRSSGSPLVTEKSHHQRLSPPALPKLLVEQFIFVPFLSLPEWWLIFFFFNLLTFPFLFPLKKQLSKWESVMACPNLLSCERQWPAWRTRMVFQGRLCQEGIVCRERGL